MAQENAKIDNNFKKTMLGVTDDASQEIRRLRVDATTGRLLCQASFSDITTLSNPSTDTLNTPADAGFSNNSNISGGILSCIDAAAGDTAITAAAWIEDEKYGWYAAATATAWSAEFDSAVKRTGKYTLKVSTTDATGKAYAFLGSAVSVGAPTIIRLKKYGIRLKASTSYRFSCWVKTNNVAVNSVYVSFTEYDSSAAVLATNSTSTISGTNDWALKTLTFTTNASTIYGSISCLNFVAGNVSDAWFDVNSMFLEEIYSITNTNEVPERLRLVGKAITQVDNIDQSLDYAGAYADIYTLPAAINEGATHRQTFTPTKKYVNAIAVWPVTIGTGNWTLTVHNTSNNALVTSTVTNANMVAGAMFTFRTPTVWTSGDLHFHLTSTVADGTIKTNTNEDEETASYIQYYAKKCEGIKVSCNGIVSKMISDQDGLLSNSIIDVDNGKYYCYSPVSTTGSVQLVSDRLVNVFSHPWLVQYNLLTSGGTYSYYALSSTDSVILKVNTLYPIKRFSIKAAEFGIGGAEVLTLALSSDNINYTDFDANVAGTSKTLTADTTVYNENNIVYVKITQSGGGTSYVGAITIEADIDTTRVPQGVIYPIGTNQFTETIKLPQSTSRVYLQTNKYTNDKEANIPFLEFTDASANVIETVPLYLDNSQETNPSIDIIIAETTNGQQSGTGSADSTTGYILNAGEYMTFSSAITEGKIVYKVGKGTTAFTNITKNVVYLSSNANSANSLQDPSHQASVDIGLRKQGIIQEVGDIRQDVAYMRKTINIPYYGMNTGSGTAYTLTTSLAAVTFGTSGAMEVLLPQAGTYRIAAQIHEDFSGVTASAAANYSLYQLYVDGQAYSGSEKIGNGFSILAGAIVGANQNTREVSWIVNTNKAGTLVNLYGKQNSATTGNWVITSDATGYSVLSFIKIA